MKATIASLLIITISIIQIIFADNLIQKITFAFLMVVTFIYLLFRRDESQIKTEENVTPKSANILFKDFTKDEKKWNYEALRIVKEITENTRAYIMFLLISGIMSIPVFLSEESKDYYSLLLLSLLLSVYTLLSGKTSIMMLKKNRVHLAVFIIALTYIGAGGYIHTAYYYFYFLLFLWAMTISVIALIYFMKTKRNFYELLIYGENRLLTDTVLFSRGYIIIIDIFSLATLLYGTIHTLQAAVII